MSWTPPDTGSYLISLQGSTYDTWLMITPPACGAEPYACNDDCFGLQSGIVFDATMGDTVFIVIDGFAGYRGSFELAITEAEQPSCGYYGDTTGY